MQDLRHEADYLYMEGLVGLIDAQLRDMDFVELSVADGSHVQAQEHRVLAARSVLAKGSLLFRRMVFPEHTQQGYLVRLDAQGRPLVLMDPEHFDLIYYFLAQRSLPADVEEAAIKEAHGYGFMFRLVHHYLTGEPADEDMEDTSRERVLDLIKQRESKGWLRPSYMLVSCW
jgi:hypothetical protein